MKPHLKETDVTGLAAPDWNLDLLRDLHVFLDYVRERDVKRMVRNNWLSKADYRRLARLMTDQYALEDIKNNDISQWVDFVDT
ncbi:MAG: hypothetical protein ACE5GO_04050, partial [Anaerolineales bacterium]